MPKIVVLGPVAYLKTSAIAALLLLPALAPANGAEVPGQHFEVSPDELAAPYATPATASRSQAIVRPAGVTLSLPAGFSSNLFAEGLDHARWLAVAANGDVFLAEPMTGKITMLRDADGDGTAEMRTTYADGFERPHGLAFHDGALYVGDLQGVWRIAYNDGDTQARDRTMITEPGAFEGGSRLGHWTRNVTFGPDGRMYVAIGSANNISIEPAPRATIQVFENGTLTTFASGLRNPVGIAFYPGTNDLYTVVNERDGLGDDLVPDYFTRVQPGGFYGWPYSYLGSHPDPEFGDQRPDLVDAAIVPDVLFESHSAPLGIVFYDGTQFPESYRGGAFVALHGSWNSSAPTGYKIVHVPFESGSPSGGYDNFALGFWPRGDGPAEVIGRPVGLALARDGSLLVADDAGNAVWRIAYTGN